MSGHQRQSRGENSTPSKSVQKPSGVTSSLTTGDLWSMATAQGSSLTNVAQQIVNSCPGLDDDVFAVVAFNLTAVEAQALGAAETKDNATTEDELLEIVVRDTAGNCDGSDRDGLIATFRKFGRASSATNVIREESDAPMTGSSATPEGSPAATIDSVEAQCPSTRQESQDRASKSDAIGRGQEKAPVFRAADANLNANKTPRQQAGPSPRLTRPEASNNESTSPRDSFDASKRAWNELKSTVKGLQRPMRADDKESYRIPKNDVPKTSVPAIQKKAPKKILSQRVPDFDPDLL